MTPSMVAIGSSGPYEPGGASQLDRAGEHRPVRVCHVAMPRASVASTSTAPDETASPMVVVGSIAHCASDTPRARRVRATRARRASGRNRPSNTPPSSHGPSAAESGRRWPSDRRARPHPARVLVDLDDHTVPGERDHLARQAALADLDEVEQTHRAGQALDVEQRAVDTHDATRRCRVGSRLTSTTSRCRRPARRWLGRRASRADSRPGGGRHSPTMPGSPSGSTADLCIGAELRCGQCAQTLQQLFVPVVVRQFAHGRCGRARAARRAPDAAPRARSRAPPGESQRAGGRAARRPRAAPSAAGGVDPARRPPRGSGPCDRGRLGQPRRAAMRRRRARRRAARREPRRGSRRQHHPQWPRLDHIFECVRCSRRQHDHIDIVGQTRPRAPLSKPHRSPTNTAAPANAKPSTRWRSPSTAILLMPCR